MDSYSVVQPDVSTRNRGRRHPQPAGAATRLALAMGLLLVSLADGGSLYSQRRPTRDGIGKVYMGREIALVMGYQGAGWLERPSRQREERSDLLIDALSLDVTDTVADIGAGTGYFSLPIAARVPEGRVLAVDLQPQMLTIIEQRVRTYGISNVETVLATETDPNLDAASVDLALFVDVYHEISHPFEVMTEIVRALKPGGRVVLIEYRAEDPEVPIKPLHKMTQRQARKEMKAVGLRWVETLDLLPQQHFMVFEKPAG